MKGPPQPGHMADGRSFLLGSRAHPATAYGFVSTTCPGPSATTCEMARPVAASRQLDMSCRLPREPFDCLGHVSFLVRALAQRARMKCDAW